MPTDLIISVFSLQNRMFMNFYTKEGIYLSYTDIIAVNEVITILERIISYYKTSSNGSLCDNRAVIWASMPSSLNIVCCYSTCSCTCPWSHTSSFYGFCWRRLYISDGISDIFADYQFFLWFHVFYSLCIRKSDPLLNTCHDLRHAKNCLALFLLPSILFLIWLYPYLSQ